MSRLHNDSDCAQCISDSLTRAYLSTNAFSAGRWYGKAALAYEQMESQAWLDAAYPILQKAWTYLSEKHGFPIDTLTGRTDQV